MTEIAHPTPVPALTLGGETIETDEVFDVVNPATGDVFAQAPVAGAQHVELAVAAAQAAFDTWRRDDGARRGALLAAADAIDAASDRLSTLLTAEQGQPLAAATSEVGATTAWLRYYANLELPREVVQDDDQGFA
jgi:acyl-CoA reductase-like NAD-dependent aldehyde dehydrogenase